MPASDRADATFKTLLRAAMSPFHVVAQALSQTMFGGRVSRTTVDNARLRVARATDMVVMRCLGQWVASAAQDSVTLAIKGRAVSNPAITDQGSSPDNGLCDIERIVDGIIGDSGGCDPGRSSCALEASSSDLDRSSCALVPPSYHLDVVRRTDSTPRVYLLSHGRLILRQHRFIHDLMWPLSVVCLPASARRVPIPSISVGQCSITFQGDQLPTTPCLLRHAR